MKTQLNSGAHTAISVYNGWSRHCREFFELIQLIQGVLEIAIWAEFFMLFNTVQKAAPISIMPPWSMHCTPRASIYQISVCTASKNNANICFNSWHLRPYKIKWKKISTLHHSNFWKYALQQLWSFHYCNSWLDGWERLTIKQNKINLNLTFHAAHDMALTTPGSQIGEKCWNGCENKCMVSPISRHFI